ncbi:MAG: hypothetical protein IKC07_04270 [Clostridia bacterium]|nr:hypothetical protein [Clostridia bacterium]
MRYYGMSNKSASAPVLDAEEKAPTTRPMEREIPFEPVPYEMQMQNTESRTFNRPQNQTGIYNGQIAQNVNEVRPDTPAPAPYENRPSSTIYQYPAGQTPSMGTLKCDIETDFKNHLCTHLGDYAYIELLNGAEKNGMISSVGENFLTLRDGANHIMCPLDSINSITVYNYTK